MNDLDAISLAVFHTELGWMAMAGADGTLLALTFGYRRREEAVRAIPAELRGGARGPAWNASLVERLRAYAEGAADDFLDVPIDPGTQSAFRKKVIACCRRIPWGSTTTYGELAARAGSPGAARAVGQCMATNRIPLVVPCHRVIGSGGRLHGFSAPEGLAMKRRLLELESAPIRL